MMQYKSLGKVQMNAAETNQWARRKNTGQGNIRKTVKITFDTASKLDQHERSESELEKEEGWEAEEPVLYSAVYYSPGLRMPGKRLPVDGGMQCFGRMNREKRTFRENFWRLLRFKS